MTNKLSALPDCRQGLYCRLMSNSCAQSFLFLFHMFYNSILHSWDIPVVQLRAWPHRPHTGKKVQYMGGAKSLDDAGHFPKNVTKVQEKNPLVLETHISN